MFSRAVNALSRQLSAKLKLALAAGVLSAFTLPVFAADGFDAAVLSKKVEKLIGLNVLEAKPSPLPGIAEIVTKQGLFYTSFDGEYLIQGKMYQLADDKVTDVTEASLSAVRLKGVEKFADDMIEFKAKDEKHVVTVFTDITCSYCRKMHDQMDEYNDLGITIRYLAYPRAGVTDRTGRVTKGFEDLRSIWCHENPSKALTKAKAGQPVAQRICDKPIEEEFNFGRQIGVTGTPAIILANGNMRPGYVPPENLIMILESL